MYQKWVVEIKEKLVEVHPLTIACMSKSKVPHMEVCKVHDDKEPKYIIRAVCRNCYYNTKGVTVDISKDQLPAARWFALVGAWCREWNFHLKALIDLEKNTRATELEISVRGLEEIVYNQLKPEYDERKGDVPPPKVGDNILRISNLSSDTKKSDLENKFHKWGRLMGVTVGDGFAFLGFEDPRDANDALRREDGSDLNGKCIKVERCPHNNTSFSISSCEECSTKE